MRLLLAALLLPGLAQAAVLEVGEGAAHATLAAAARAAQDGDTIRLAAGEYFECAVLLQRDLVIEGAGAATVITDRTCEGKALLVARGNNLTVRDLVLARARVPDGNGAGIRLEAQGLTVERVRFENNQLAVLAGAGGPGRVLISECAIQGGGMAEGKAGFAIMAGEVLLLRVERSVFEEVRGGLIGSGALRTEVTSNRLSAGVAEGAGPVVQVSGRLLMQDNEIALGPFAPAQGAAVIASGDGAELRQNRMRNRTGQPMVLLLDWMDRVPLVQGNMLETGDTLVSSSGSWRHKASVTAHGVVDGLRGAARGAKRAIGGLFGP